MGPFPSNAPDTDPAGWRDNVTRLSFDAEWTEGERLDLEILN